jgi:hypothetical protein
MLLIFGKLEGIVHHDPKKPRCKGTRFVKLIDPFCNPDEGSLHNILRDSSVIENQIGSVNGPRLVSIYQRLQPS